MPFNRDLNDQKSKPDEDLGEDHSEQRERQGGGLEGWSKLRFQEMGRPACLEAREGLGPNPESLWSAEERV